MHFNKAIENEYVFHQRRKLLFTDEKHDSFYYFDLDEYLNHHNHNPFLNGTIGNRNNVNAIGNDCNRDLVITRLKLPSLPPYRLYPNAKWSLVSFCCGLVLFRLGVKYYVANPATRKYKILPDQVPWPDAPPIMPYNGFGYDHSTDDFKVVTSKASRDGIEFVVFALKTSCWRKIQRRFPYYAGYRMRRPYNAGPGYREFTHNFGYPPRAGILLNGRLHWLMRRLEDDTQVIVSLCLADEEVREIPLPRDLGVGALPLLELGLFFNDSLCIAHIFETGLSIDPTTGTSHDEFWVMKEYEVAESWTKRELCSGSEGSLLPTSYQRENHALFWCPDSRGWRMKNIKALCCQSLSIPGYPIVTGAGFYVESLVSLDTGKGRMSAPENVVGRKHKRKENAPGDRNEKKHKKHSEVVKKIGPGRLPSFVRERLIRIGKALDEKDLTAGSKGKESDVHPKTYIRDDFLGKEVPVSEVEGKTGGCAVCGSWDHCNDSCPCLKYFPKGTKIGADYETICRGCGCIGEVCCPKKGGYALLKECDYCYRMGHWQWEDSEECCRLNGEVFPKPEFLDVNEEEEEDPESIIHPKIIYSPPWRHGSRENA